MTFVLQRVVNALKYENYFLYCYFEHYLYAEKFYTESKRDFEKIPFLYDKLWIYATLSF